MRVGARKSATVVMAMTLVFVSALSAVAVASPTITEYSVGSDPSGITTGSDGALWFTNAITDSINRITTSGTVTAYTLQSTPRPYHITLGPDGALWFTQGPPNSATPGIIGRITTSGTITEYPLTGTYAPGYITTGPDGALWFTETVGADNSGAIGRITTSGTITQYAYPSSIPELAGIAAGSDGALWVAEYGLNGNSTGSAIGRITTSGTITRYPISFPNGLNAGPSDIASGSDGALWFTEDGDGSHIGRITTNGLITQYPVTTGPRDITAGPDGALWFTGYTGNQIGRITTSGTITEYPVPSGTSYNPYSITAGPDGALWFTEYSAGKIGRITTPQPSPQPTYYTENDGNSFARSSSPFGSGISTQTINADGSVTTSVNNASGYADSGYVLYEGTLGDLPDFVVNGSGSDFGLNLWFDINNDGEYFNWNQNGVLTSLGGDTYGLSPGSQNGALSVDGTTQFFMMSDGQNHSLSDLKNGAVSGIDANTKVAVWIGVDVSNGGSASATINSVDGL